MSGTMMRWIFAMLSSPQIGIDAYRLAAAGLVGQRILCRSPRFRGFANTGFKT
jgi:hypothetical protein